jgi:hypothetical protein
MKKFTIFLILALAIPYAAFSQTYFGYSGGGGGLPFVIDPGTSSGQLLIWDGSKWTPASETTQFYYDATDGFVAFPTSAGSPGFTVMESGATPLEAVVLSGDDTYGYFYVYRNGAVQHSIEGNGESVFNETGNGGGDTRFESNGKAYMLFVDAGSDSVGINTVLPTGAELVVTSTSQAQSRLLYDGSNYADLTVDSGGDLAIDPTGVCTISSGGDDVVEFSWMAGPMIKSVYDVSNYTIWDTNSGGVGTFWSNGTESFTFAASGILGGIGGNGRAQVNTEIASATNPVFVIGGDPDTGIGSSGDDELSLIAGGVNVANFGTTATIPSGQIRSVTTVNAATYDLLVSDYILSVTYTATGAVTSLTLPTAQTVAGRIVVVKDAGGNAGTNNITIDTEGAQNIDGVSTYVINSNYQSAPLYCDGTNWFAF